MQYVAPGMRIWYTEKSGEGQKWNPNSAWTKWDEYFKSEKSYGEFSTDSNSVSVIVMETNELFRLIERKPAPVQLTWWLNKENKIEGYLVKSLADATHTDRLDEFAAWARKNYPEELNYLMPGGNINPEEDRPGRWEKILKEWRATITHDLSFFAGKWEFKIWSADNKSDTPDFTAVWVHEKALDSAECFTGQVQYEGGIFTREMVVRNNTTHEYERIVATNNGDYFVLKTKGWNGNKLTWTGTQYSASGKTELKEEIERSGENKFKATFYALENNQWELMQTEILTRVK
ncbi:MAG: hypothetical protein KIT62_10715 [Cyclobacteriaceae bacterium]|nr:hypothetical protein [Cyclobacteriaceae bacterium]